MFIYIHSKREQKKSSPIIKLQCCHFDIVILRVAVISNAQNVRLQRRHRPTDDATRRWRGSQQTGPVRATRRSDASAARRRPRNKISKCMPCFAHFPRFRHCKNYLNWLRFDRVAIKCTLLRFMNHGENVGFNFSR